MCAHCTVCQSCHGTIPMWSVYYCLWKMLQLYLVLLAPNQFPISIYSMTHHCAFIPTMPNEETSPDQPLAAQKKILVDNFLTTVSCCIFSLYPSTSKSRVSATECPDPVVWRHAGISFQTFVRQGTVWRSVMMGRQKSPSTNTEHG